MNLSKFLFQLLPSNLLLVFSIAWMVKCGIKCGIYARGSINSSAREFTENMLNCETLTLILSGEADQGP